MKALCAQFARFGAIGAVGTLTHYALLLALVQAAGVDAVAASALGAAAGAGVNYALNYRYTFRSARRHREALPRFLAIAAAGLALNTFLMWLLVEGLRLHYFAAQLVATAGVLGWNFLANRHWTFGKDAA
ncbi:MAG: GtrA family protein [Thiobacillus sp.]|nr:GtrA family protein [Thiobacillus sp.]